MILLKYNEVNSEKINFCGTAVLTFSIGDFAVVIFHVVHHHILSGQLARRWGQC